MEYRINKRTGDKVSIIGFGTSSICKSEESEFLATLEMAYEAGINYFDLATSASSTFPVFGKAFAKCRNKVMYQVHFGADYTKKEYGWTTDPKCIKESIAYQLNALQTDYIDYGFIHCMDEEKDWNGYRESGALDYLLEMKKKGVVRHIGLSSHSPKLVRMIAETGLLDVVMFSINPAYDYEKGDSLGIGGAEERMDLYRYLESKGIGITVMKPFFAGQLLDPRTSPFGMALNESQCIQYVLDKPGVLCALPGVRNRKELAGVLHYLEASKEERDYSILSSFAPAQVDGKCVYCNHCAPCPVGLDIGMINKYYDLAKAGDVLAAGHYEKLAKHASDCIGCGHCNSRCPFHVKQKERMQEIAQYFTF